MARPGPIEETPLADFRTCMETNYFGAIRCTIINVTSVAAWQLRHPVGPDAAPFLGWRVSMNDENWVRWSAQSDSDWLQAVKTDFGMDLKLG